MWLHTTQGDKHTNAFIPSLSNSDGRGQSRSWPRGRGLWLDCSFYDVCGEAEEESSWFLIGRKGSATDSPPAWDVAHLSVYVSHKVAQGGSRLLRLWVPPLCYSLRGDWEDWYWQKTSAFIHREPKITLFTFECLLPNKQPRKPHTCLHIYVLKASHCTDIAAKHIQFNVWRWTMQLDSIWQWTTAFCVTLSFVLTESQVLSKHF